MVLGQMWIGKTGRDRQFGEEDNGACWVLMMAAVYQNEL